MNNIAYTIRKRISVRVLIIVAASLVMAGVAGSGIHTTASSSAGSDQVDRINYQAPASALTSNGTGVEAAQQPASSSSGVTALDKALRSMDVASGKNIANNKGASSDSNSKLSNTNTTQGVLVDSAKFNTLSISLPDSLFGQGSF